MNRLIIFIFFVSFLSSCQKKTSYQRALDIISTYESQNLKDKKMAKKTLLNYFESDKSNFIFFTNYITLLCLQENYEEIIKVSNNYISQENIDSISVSNGFIYMANAYYNIGEIKTGD